MRGTRRGRHGWRLSLCIALAAGCLAASARSVRAQHIVIGDFYAEPDLRDEAGAVTLLVRSMLASSKRPVISRGDLYGALTRIGGDQVRVGLVVAPRYAKQLAAELAASHVIGGHVEREGVGLAASVRVFDASGRSLGVFRFVVGDGDVTGLAKQIAVLVGRLVGTDPRKHPAASVGQLRPFSRAAVALLRADVAMAAAALLSADSLTAGRVPAAREIAEPVWRSSAVPFGVRIAAALGGVDPGAAKALAEEALAADRKDVAALAGQARAHLGALDLAGAERVLAKVPRKLARSPEVFLAKAELAQRRGNRGDRDAALVPLLGGAPHVPALPFVATLPPGDMDDALEAAALASAHYARGPHPRLSAALALRAARGNVDVEAALALVHVVELDDTEIGALAPIIDEAVAAGWPIGHRLAVELAMRRGAIAPGIASARKYIELRPADPLGHLYLGRLLADTGDDAGASDAFGAAAAAGDDANTVRDAVREQARALERAGKVSDARARWRSLEPDATSAELLRVRAESMLADGDATQAVLALERAAALDPNDARTQRDLADLYQQAGRNADAIAARKRADAIAQEGKATAPTAADDADISGGAEATGATEAKMSAEARRAQAEVSRLAEDLPRLLDAFPAIADRTLRKVVLVRLEGSREPFYSPQQVVPERLGDALARALAAEPYRMQVVVSSARPQAEPLRATRLNEFATDEGADSVLLYRVRADGNDAVVKLSLFLVESHQAYNASDTFPGRTTGMVVWNRTFLLLAGGMLALVIGWFALGLVRGRGELIVRIKLDQGTDEDAISIKLARAGGNPGVADPIVYMDESLRAGHKKTRTTASVVGPVTQFGGLSTGRWHVHVFGTYRKGGELRVLPDTLSERVPVRRNDTTYVDFDLVPNETEFVVRLFDGQAASSGARVWVDDDRAGGIATDREGTARVLVPRGAHVIHIAAGSMNIVRRVTVTDTKVHNVNVNLQRERRMADVSGGLSLEGPQAAQPAPVPANSTFALTDSAGRSMPAGSAAFAHGADAAHSKTMAHGSQEPLGASAMAGPADATMAGLGRYQVSLELGRGAMGVVYKARDVHLERDVALKIMTEEMRQHPGALELFLREAKSLAQLNHPNVVTVFDQGQDAGRAFMVMEFVEGRTLEALLESDSALALPRALDVCDQLCNGLAYAHGRKVIHRDIKPANVFISSDGIVKLGDFGLARVVHEIKIQRTEIRGTPLYMAPEQIRGTDIDFRADLYAVGCTLFELVTGRPPFIEGEILYHHMHTPPPRPTRFNSDLPPALDGLIMRCIEKDPAQRPESAAAIRAALRPLIQRYG